MVDFVNDQEDILLVFKVYYETAELANVTEPFGFGSGLASLTRDKQQHMSK